MKTQLENALAFANNNVKVFPLSYNSKSEQILSSWKNEATTDVNQIKKWFENTELQSSNTYGKWTCGD